MGKTVVMGSQKLTSGAVTVTVRVINPNYYCYFLGVLPEQPSNFDRSIKDIGCGLEDYEVGICSGGSVVVSTSSSYRDGDKVCSCCLINDSYPFSD